MFELGVCVPPARSQTPFLADTFELLGRSLQPHAEGDGATDPQADAIDEVHWNFEKFLVDRSGGVIRRFVPEIKPEDRAVVGAIEAALGG